MKVYTRYFKTFIYIQLLIFLTSFFIDLDWKLAGAFSGKFSIWVFWIIAIPGILQRLKAQNSLQKIQLFLMKYRRYLGIIMFNFAFIHFMWLRGFSYIEYGFPDIVPTYQIFGTVALLLLFPLYLTSNNFSLKKLGKKWKLLHRLVYPSMFLLVLHTSLQGLDYALIYGFPTLIVFSLQMYSHMYAAKLRR
jgi:DMSO/TMAO reductase YedYZ heme-binding membrane subunit